MKYIKRKLLPVNLVNGRNNSEYFYSRYRDMIPKEIKDDFVSEANEDNAKTINEKTKRESFLSSKPKKKNKKSFIPKLSKKEKLPSPKFITDEQLAEMGYPKTYFDPTDEEFDKDGVPNYYFNINKTFEKYHLNKLAQKLPMDKLDDFTYDKPFFDNLAIKQHASVEKINSLNPKEQYKKDYQRKNSKKYFLGGSIVALLCLIFMVIVPNIQFSMGMSAFEKKDYESAKNLFSLAGSHSNADVYKYFCAAKVDIAEKKYDDAKAKFKRLIEGKYKVDNIDLNDMLLDVDYQKALDYYSAGDYNNAKKTFYSIMDYSDAKDYYFKCGYKLGSDYYEQGKTAEALREFFYVKSYNDAAERIDEIAGSIYDSGLAYYNKGDYSNAAVEFGKISEYDYKDSASMKEQCTYRNGINFIVAGQYEDAINTLKSLDTYKDSSALLNEAYYRLGNELFLDSPASSIKYYSLIPTYRNVEEKLLLPQLILYGSWDIAEIDNISQNDLSFTFNENGDFITKNNLNNVAISTEAMAHPYTWSNNMFVSDGYTIKISVKDYDNIEIKCGNSGKETLYKCVRTSMLGQNSQVNDVDKSNPFDKDTIEYYLQEYVNEKTDGIVIINNTKYTLEDLLDRKILKESSPSEAK